MNRQKRVVSDRRITAVSALSLYPGSLGYSGSTYSTQLSSASPGKNTMITPHRSTPQKKTKKNQTRRRGAGPLLSS